MTCLNSKAIHQADMFEVLATGEVTTEDNRNVVLFSAGGYEDDFLQFFASLEDVRAKDPNFDRDFKKVLKAGREDVLQMAPTSRSKAVFFPVN